ncbi:MAG: PilZ domain-containing protein [Candidatus Omnitrophica bacterium]|nr:PilZ domain-containing protein [Candidatus Omnitrophota bacterium]
MQISVREKEKIAILDLKGNIDINASNFIETIGWTIEHRSKNIVCNFSEINLVDYVGVSLIAVAYKNVLNHKSLLKICSLPQHIQKLFKLVGITKIIEIYNTEEDAIASFQNNETIDKIMQQKLRRRFKRLDIQKNIEYKEALDEFSLFHKGKIINLSAIGILVAGPTTFPAESQLLARMHLGNETGIIEVSCRVIWTIKKKNQQLESPTMGLEFHLISQDTQNRIIQFIERNFSFNR